MDIIDIILAKAMTPQGQISTYAALAQNAVSQASTAVTNANQAVSVAETASQAANSALEQLQGITEDLTEAAHNEIDKLAFDLLSTVTNQSIDKAIKIIYPSEQEDTLENVVKYYKSLGQNQDGTMTQKAITEAINNIQISGGGSTNLGPQNAGYIVVVGENGNIISSSSVSEEDILDIINKANPHVVEGTVGLEVDYTNYSFLRTEQAAEYNYSSDFDKYPMYGGRTRCLVDNNGNIVSFYGDVGYTDTPSNGYQVMIYQPKFYYSRNLISTSEGTQGLIIRKEKIAISSSPQQGYKLHPLFINENGEELEYVLLSAYEGSIQSTTGNSYTDNAIANFSEQKLSSVSNAKPISGVNNDFTIEVAQQLANNRGNGWHITNLKFESAMQMLQAIEFGNFNGQISLESGICDIDGGVLINCSANTGSTSALGNSSGHANSTVFNYSGETHSYSTEGKRAISYRGMQNPWGNMWRFVGGVNIMGNNRQGGEVYICNNFNYNYNNFSSNYKTVGFYLPNNSNWISGFGYGNSELDWAFIPAESSNSANSAYPIGDNIWVNKNLNKNTILTCGGSWGYGQNNGPFYYAGDNQSTSKTARCNARLMYIPHINDTYYQSNIDKWTAKYGG